MIRKVNKKVIITVAAAIVLLAAGLVLFLLFNPFRRQMPSKGTVNELLPFLSGASSAKPNNAFTELYFSKSSITVKKLNKTSGSSGTAEIVVRTPDIGSLLQKESEAVAAENKGKKAAELVGLVKERVQNDLKTSSDYLTTDLTVPLVNDGGTWKLQENYALVKAMSGGAFDKLPELFKSAKVGSSK